MQRKYPQFRKYKIVHFIISTVSVSCIEYLLLSFSPHNQILIRIHLFIFFFCFNRLTNTCQDCFWVNPSCVSNPSVCFTPPKWRTLIGRMRRYISHLKLLPPITKEMKRYDFFRNAKSKMLQTKVYKFN